MLQLTNIIQIIYKKGILYKFLTFANVFWGWRNKRVNVRARVHLYTASQSLSCLSSEVLSTKELITLDSSRAR